MNTTKRIKLGTPSDNDERTKDIDEHDEHVNQEDHCTICLQQFLDRTIIPVCAHEFCFECIHLWSEQSRKCPLCSRSFADAYLIHRIRSQHDYQKHYLLPLRSSPPPLTGESRTNALRNTRRERQWGRRQRQQREAQDQLERAIARRRWIYQHHLYAKHVASNSYTRYRPFPTPAQFAASQDLISRMMMFLRRELRVWPNLDVEFLTTYTISLMKSIDIRSESAVKLLSEFLDLDTPYTPGTRQLNAEHFAHEVYSYLRSPYRDLDVYDQIAQYDTPPEISPPRDIDTGNRWSAGPSRSRSRSNSRCLSPAPYRENNGRNVRNSSAEVSREAESSRRHSRGRSPRSTTPGREDRIHSCDRSLSSPGGVRDSLLRHDNSHPRGVSCPDTSSSAVVAENSPFPPHFRDDKKGNDQAVPAADTPKLNVPRDDRSAAALIVGMARVARSIEGTGDESANYVDNVSVSGGSAANSQQSRERSTGVGARVRHRHRTLSESVQAYLSRPATRHPPRNPISKPARPVADGSTRPSLFLRLSDGPLDPDVGNTLSFRKTPVERTPDGGLSPYDGDATSKQMPMRSPRGSDDASVGPFGPVRGSQDVVIRTLFIFSHGWELTIGQGGDDEVMAQSDGHGEDASRTDEGATDVDTAMTMTRLRMRAHRVSMRLAALKAEGGMTVE
ncbi:hypothetical protein JVU11DRAFT_6783 [Chiua virens]|nr:hypothetical protein JVU11DRAFT_6783 [Chiua virens]